MAQTTFKLATSKTDVPLTDGSSSAQKTSNGSNTKTGNQGFLTDAPISKDVISTVSSPVVSGAFLLAGIILLFALIAKIKKNKNSDFKDSLTRKHYTTRIIGFATFLTIAAGLGGTMARFMSVEASTPLNDITTSNTVDAHMVGAGDDYRLYCGTDDVTLDGPSANGYYLFMHADDDGTLASETTGISDINSTDYWDSLPTGSWGYYVGSIENYDNAIKNPMPIGYSIIDSKTSATQAGIIPVTYCAKVAASVDEANFSTNITYEVLPLDEGIGFDLDLDFNSANDDDGDELPNRLENRLGMNPFSIDSDMDGLSDHDEIYEYHTDPLLGDTDNDRLYDYSEVALSINGQYDYDPNTPDYNGETITYSEPNGETTGVPFTVTGTGNIPLTYIDTVEPNDIDESLGELSGTAYTFSSVGKVSSATITVPYATEAEINTMNDVTNDYYGGIEVSDDFAGSNDLYAVSLTFDGEDVEEGEDMTAIVEDITKTVNSSNRTVTINIADNNSIVLVGNEDIGSTDPVTGDTYSGLLSRIIKKKSKSTSSSSSSYDDSSSTLSKIKTVLRKIKEKIILPLLSVVLKVATSFVVQYDCTNNGGTWDQVTEQCIYQGTGDTATYDDTEPTTVDNSWTKSNSFANDVFYPLQNYTDTRYDANNQGVCYGINLLARLLYLNKINLNKQHTVKDYIASSDGSITRKFTLEGLGKEDILHVEKLSNGLPNDPDVRNTIYGLYLTQFDKNLTKSYKNSFVRYVKGNVEYDPVLIAVTGGIGYSFNVIKMSYNNSEYSLNLYDSGLGILQNRKIDCSKATCTMDYGNYTNLDVIFLTLGKIDINQTPPIYGELDNTFK